MAGPGKALKKFGLQKANSGYDIPPLQKSRSSRDVPKPHKSSSSHDVPQLHKSSNGHDVSKPHKSSSSHDVPQLHKSSNSRDVPKPHNSSSSCNIPQLEPHQEEDEEINSPEIETNTSDPQQEENIGSLSYATSVTRKESRVLSETRKRRLNKGQFTFEVDECAGRIIGEDSQRFITMGGCLMRQYAKFDGTTWRNQPDMLKTDIINKCMENSNYDPNCRLMVRAIQTQLASQHKNRQYKLHMHFKKFATKEEAVKHPPNNISVIDWVTLCEKFASEEFQKLSTKNKKNHSMNEIPPIVGTVSIARIVDMKRREGEEVSAIEQYKIGHFSKKRNKMVNEKADEILNELQREEAVSSCSPAEICLKKLHRIPGYIKGRSASTKQTLATENLRMELEIEKKRSKALEEEIRVIKEEQILFHEEHNEMKQKMNFMMEQLSRLSELQS